MAAESVPRSYKSSQVPPSRTAFRQVAQAQWKDLVQQISYSLGFAGTVSDVSASSPEAINEPFHFSYSYNRKEYPEWSNHHFTVPGLPFLMPLISDDANDPVWLGSPEEILSESSMAIPKGYRPDVPSEVNLNYDFAEYHASYSLEQGTLVSKRRLLLKLHEVPRAELDLYRGFVKNMQDDVNRYVQTSSTDVPENQHNPGNVPNSSFVSILRGLPASSSAQANSLIEEAQNNLQNHDIPGAVSSLYRAVSADPKFTRAWIMLGGLLLTQKQVKAGIDAFHEAMKADPGQAAIPKALGYSLMGIGQFADAVPVWQDYTNSHADDVDGPTNLGVCLRNVGRYSEAVTAYETAVKLGGDRASLLAGLGSSHLSA